MLRVMQMMKSMEEAELERVQAILDEHSNESGRNWNRVIRYRNGLKWRIKEMEWDMELLRSHKITQGQIVNPNYRQDI